MADVEVEAGGTDRSNLSSGGLMSESDCLEDEQPSISISAREVDDTSYEADMSSFILTESENGSINKEDEESEGLRSEAVATANGTEFEIGEITCTPSLVKSEREEDAEPSMPKFTAPTKKSNLKRPTCETPDSSSLPSTPSSKRIRIVENLDVANSNNYIQLESGPESPVAFQGADDSAFVSEVTCCGESMMWLNSSSSFVDQSLVNVEFVRENLVPVKPNFSVEIDMRFVLTDTVSSILTCKSAIAGVGSSNFHLWVAQNHLPNKDLKFVYKENFVKMANIDALLDGNLSSPQELTTTTTIDSGSDFSFDEDNIYFVGDLWHNSKGFREYLLWKTSQSHKVFSTKILTMRTSGPRSNLNSFSLKTGICPNDFIAPDCEDLSYLPTETVEAHGIDHESQNILAMGVLSSFIEFLISRTNGKGLHTLLVDNPEISHVYESCREIRYQKYFYCQCILALKCLREGGTFICKIFDTLTLFTNGLLFLLYKCFKNITVHKPSSSEKFTSERFLICKGKIDNADTKYIVDFLFDCLDMVVNNQEQRRIVRRRVRKRLAVYKMEVQAIVPLKVILSHVEFFQFLRQTNIRLSTDLIESIDQLTNLMEEGNSAGLTELAAVVKSSQISLLSTLNIFPGSDVGRTPTMDPLKDCNSFFQTHNISQEITLESRIESFENFYKSTQSAQSFVAFPIQESGRDTIFTSIRGLFYGGAKSKILHYESGTWRPLNCPGFSLPQGTILIGEIVEEICLQEKLPTFVKYFHLFDAVFLSGLYIGSVPLINRQKMLTRFIGCLSNSTSHINENYRVIPPIPLSNLSSFYQSNATSLDITSSGYGSGVKFYKTFVSMEEDQENWSLISGFALIKGLEDSCPESFFKNYQCTSWTWKNGEPNFGDKLILGIQSDREEPST